MSSEKEEKKKEKSYRGWLISFFIVLIAAGVLLLIFGIAGGPDDENQNPSISANLEASENSSINTTELAKCLSEHDIIVYYSSTCPACRAQMELFGSGWDALNKVNCSENLAACRNANIQYIPTWIKSDTGEPRVGVQELDELAKWCNYNTT